jgi:hypothetical protein
MNKTLRFLSQLVILDFLIFSAFFLFKPTAKLTVNNQSPQVEPTVTVARKNIPAGTVPTQNQPSITDTPQPATPSPTSAPDLFSELPQHNSSGDCWMAIGGRLYDITRFFGQHPGGDSSLSAYCGTDATTAFNTKDKNPGSSHSAAAAAMLGQYLIQ